MDVVALLRLPGVITGVAASVPETEEEQERLGKLLDSGLRDALAKLDDMRRAEGRHLVEELRDRLGRIGGGLGEGGGGAGAVGAAFFRRPGNKGEEVDCGDRRRTGRRAAA